METGEYFLTEKQKQSRKEKEKAVAQQEAVANKQQERLNAFKPPKVINIYPEAILTKIRKRKEVLKMVHPKIATFQALKKSKQK